MKHINKVSDKYSVIGLPYLQLLLDRITDICDILLQHASMYCSFTVGIFLFLISKLITTTLLMGADSSIYYSFMTTLSKERH